MRLRRLNKFISLATVEVPACGHLQLIGLSRMLVRLSKIHANLRLLGSSSIFRAMPIPRHFCVWTTSRPRRSWRFDQQFVKMSGNIECRWCWLKAEGCFFVRLLILRGRLEVPRLYKGAERACALDGRKVEKYSVRLRCPDQEFGLEIVKVYRSLCGKR